MLNSQNFVVFYSPFSCYCFLITNRATEIASVEMDSTHSADSTGGSMMFVNHADVRIAHTEVRGGLNLVYNLHETRSPKGHHRRLSPKLGSLSIF